MTDEERIERLENKLKEALSWWRATEKQLLQKCKETKTNQKTIERLKAENAELRATLSKMETVEKELRERLEKAVELPRIIHPNEYEWFVQYQNKYGLIFDEIFYSERAAEARLKELKEKNND